jgi:hypothetical protein
MASIYLTTIAFHRDNPIYPSELERYKQDSKRALKSRANFRRNRIKGHWTQLFNRLTLPNSSVSLLLAVATLFASHTLYA